MYILNIHILIIVLTKLYIFNFSVDTLKQQLLARGEDLVWDKVSCSKWLSKFRKNVKH